MKPTAERIHQLNQGLAESKNLMETLAVDFGILMPLVVPGFTMPAMPEKVGIVKRMHTIATALHAQHGIEILPTLQSHTSDMIRGLACYVIAIHQASLQEKLELIKPLADDPNSGVREWAWLALRPVLIESISQALILLEPWTKDTSERIRRFSSEATRPRGVWSAHCAALRKEPWLALNILEPLKADTAKYVQLSVANWLNDAGKDHPVWVQDLCARWVKESPSDATHKICKRAQRNF